jgi:hypothetical protein
MADDGLDHPGGHVDTNPDRLAAAPVCRGLSSCMHVRIRG